jgi:aryl sulfotransferase
MLGGPLAPTPASQVDWFCSDAMWWRSWPENVESWWQWADRPNVLFVHYEEMLEDLLANVQRVASFLDVDLTPDERAVVARKSGYDYMKANEHVFEMAPPSFMSVADRGLSFLQSGSRDRDRDIGEADRERIAAFVRERLEGATYPLARFYPEIARASRAGSSSGWANS